jgi:DNA-directed RNA polymerase subunit beta'
MDIHKETQADFDAIRLSLASPDDIHKWSHGEILRPETINYRTQKPEKDGLFCERIFGPVKDWECYCGKYKKIRYKGIVCDKCGVEVTRSLVRRERMGHIDLSAPVSHIWFLRGVPSKIGLALDMSVQMLEKVIYFADFIITKVDENLKKEAVDQLKAEYKQFRKQLEGDFTNKIKQLEGNAGDKESKKLTKEITGLAKSRDEKLDELDATMSIAEGELKELKPMQIVSEHTYHELSMKYGHIFEAGIGAEAIRELLSKMDIKETVKALNIDIETASTAKRDKLVRRVRFLSHLVKNNIKPEWMVTTAVPVIPPDLRPMVPLDGGRFATSDLNDLYRRVINRNNRLKQLIELNAPEVITRNEKRMLQEAVDALIDNNARHGKTVVASTGQKRMLKSLADMLRGKQGRFRQNLLGKRVDYSGRSVIVVGPNLRINQCGIPKKMALELFKPFIIAKLIKDGIVHNVRSANRYIEAGHEKIWDYLDEIISDKTTHVLLNRAPTLHRLGIQAFKPILIDGLAIQLHPLVCSAFNADFDGDQMAVHVPLSEGAKKEAAEIMLSSHNLLKPAHGRPIVTPSQDIVWGCYYLTSIKKNETPKIFSSVNEAQMALDNETITLQDEIKVRYSKKAKGAKKTVDTTLGRIIFSSILPEDFEFVNDVVGKKVLGNLLHDLLRQYGPKRMVVILDDLKDLGFKYLTRSAQSLGMGDLADLPNRDGIIADGDKKLEEIEGQYQIGLLTDEERQKKIVQMWLNVNELVLAETKGALPADNPIYSMIDSGARGAWGQLNQMIGMKGTVVNPSNEAMELPVKGNFKSGFDVLEYFISTHGARKGLTDTALRTSSAGYLTRRLVDVAQDIIVLEKDCRDKGGLLLTKEESERMGEKLAERLIGRYTITDIIDTKSKKVLVEGGTLITEEISESLAGIDIEDVTIRSVLSCKSQRGICQKCYGYDLAYNKPVEIGVAVGIIAAQSVGEPGTQLTMRTFHTGGVASESDITQGLPRVEEIFEARNPKAKAAISDVNGIVSIKDGGREVMDIDGKKISEVSAKDRIIQISYEAKAEKKIPYSGKFDEVDFKVADGAAIAIGQLLFVDGGQKVTSSVNGHIQINKRSAVLMGDELAVKEYIIAGSRAVLVKNGDKVEAGAQLTEGSIDLHQLHEYRGREDTQRYIMREIQHIYSSQGQKLNDKHVETIARQMFSKVYISDSGDSDLMPGEITEAAEVILVNKALKKEGKKIIEFDRLLLGITKVSLSTQSWLAAASFQETSRVLINAAITGKVDNLVGLKENIIIGRLIPVGEGLKKQKADAKAKEKVTKK